ncbi:isochorismatase family protein [Peptoniphilus asaccharolyticus]
MKNFKLNKEDVLCLFVDVQDKLLSAMNNKEDVLKNTKILAQMAKIMNLDSIFTAQYPKGLGFNNEELKSFLPDAKEFPKKAFSCMMDEDFVEELKKKNKKQIILSGVEAHICVLLTARDLIAAGYEVFVASDAVGSRSDFNYKNSLEMLNEMGCVVTNTETIMFDLNSISGTDEFKAVQKLII